MAPSHNWVAQKAMKPQLGLEMRQAETLEVQLICNCCGQPYHPDKAWEDRLRAIIFGAEQYANCPSCTQQLPETVFRDEGYRQRCRDTVAKWRKQFEVENKAKSRQGDSTAEPTYEELKAQVERLEKQMRGRLQFKVSDKGGVSVYGPPASLLRQSR